MSNTKRDYFWVIAQKPIGKLFEEVILMESDSGDLLVFNTKEQVKFFMDNRWLGAEYVMRGFTWDKLIELYGKRYKWVLVDNTGEPGLYRKLPLVFVH